MNRLHSRRNNRGPKPQQPKAPFEEIPGAAFFLGKLNKNHDREHIYNELKKLTRVFNFYIRKLDMPYADKARRAGNLGYAFVHTRSAQEADRIVAMKTLKLGHQVCEVKVYGGRNEESTSEAFSGRTTPEKWAEKETTENTGFVNPLKIDVEPKVGVWARSNGAKLADIVRPRADSGCQTRNTSECEENNKIELSKQETEEIDYAQDQKIPVYVDNADAEIERLAYNNTAPVQSQLELDLQLVRNHVGDSQDGVKLFMRLCDEIYQMLQNAPQEVVYQTAQIAQIQV